MWLSQCLVLMNQSDDIFLPTSRDSLSAPIYFGTQVVPSQEKPLIRKACDISFPFPSLWQKPCFHHKYRLHREPVGRQIISHECRAAGRAKIYKEYGMGEGEGHGRGVQWFKYKAYEKRKLRWMKIQRKNFKENKERSLQFGGLEAVPLHLLKL